MPSIVQTPIHSHVQTPVLLIAADAADHLRVRAALAGEEHAYALERFSCLDEAMAKLDEPGCDMVIVAIDSPETLIAVERLAACEGAPVILALGDDEDLVGAAMNAGAQDFLLRRHISPELLPRTLRHLLERKQHELVVQAAERALHEERSRALITLAAIGDAVLTTDMLGNLTYLNETAETMLGWHQEDALGHPLTEVFHVLDGATRELAPNPVMAVINEENATLNCNFIIIRPDGSERAIECCVKALSDGDGKTSGSVVIFHDVSESRTMALKMTHLAQHDFLTGLPNRMLLTERLSQAMGMAQRNRTQVGLLFIDLDFFKHINDSLGHAVGDELLQSVAERLVSCVRATDTVCRQGGDEFVVLLTEIESHQDAAVIAEKLLAAIAEPHMIGVHELHVSLSIGIAVYPGDGKSAETLMQNADAAMYHAKVIGRNNFQFFKMEMNERAMHRSLIEASLRRAIKQKEFSLYYQPKVDIASGSIIGAEALIRWNDPKRGLVLPDEFLAIAEECGLIVPIGGWVLREACNQLRTWLRAGLKIIPVAINISAAEFKHKFFLDAIAQALRESGIPPYYLEIELTETILMRDAEFSVGLLQALKQKGVQIAIDDFGTGYSSLSYLKRFPVDTIKIDQSFMRDLGQDTDNATIVSAIIAMARNLKQSVLGEGVETAEQLSFLRNHRCNEAQGNYLSEPLPAEEFARLLTTNELPVLSVRQRTERSD